MPDDEGDELEGEVLVFCPHCAEREFGPFGGSPLDTATMGSNDAITQINLLDASADLEATIFP